MMTRHAQLLMLGPAAETPDGIATMVDAYRSHGLFRRWPITYIATHGPGSLLASTRFTWRAMARFLALLARYRHPAVHLHTRADARFWRDVVYFGAAAALRCPVILHLHGGGFEALYDASSDGGRRILRACLERAWYVAVPSQSALAWVRALSPRTRAGILPPPVALPALEEASRPNLVLFLGRLVQEKGIFDLLEAVSQVRAAVPDACLVCAGPGNRVAVARYAERLGIADAVKFTGAVGPSGKRALLESAAVFALPSSSEGLPMSLLEAMAAGVPVVACPVGAIPEVVADGVSGFHVAPGDIASLQRLLRKLLLERKLGARIGAAARETVRLRYAPERALGALDALYAELGLSPLLQRARPMASNLGRAA